MKLHSINNDEIMDQLLEDGYVIIENLIDESFVGQIAEELDVWFDKTPLCQGDFYGWNTTRFGSLLSKAPSTQKLALHSVVTPIMEKILGPNCDWYQLNVAQAVRIHPGTKDKPCFQQPPHRDQDMWPCEKNCEYMVNVIWAIDDFTEENGATIVYPKSHTTSAEFDYTTFDYKTAETKVAAMPKGSALIFLGSLIHCGGANKFFRDRTGVIFSYSLGWLKGSENQFLTYPPEVAKNFSPEIQKLIGYQIHMPNLGGYENHCPSVLLKGERPEILPAVDAFPDSIQQIIDGMKEQNLLAS